MCFKELSSSVWFTNVRHPFSRVASSYAMYTRTFRKARGSRGEFAK